MSTLQPVRVDGVSQAEDSAEAITRAVIDEGTYSFKFRRYDDGWRWEFAETRAGGWVAPDVVIAQLLEERRQKKAAEWASAHGDKYRETIDAMAGYSQNLPRRPGMSLELGWLAGREMWQKGTKPQSRTQTEHDAIVAKYLGRNRDAWGREILVDFDDTNRQATFISLGVDGQRGTADDVVCVTKGLREWDDFYEQIMWNYYKSWTVPEGLDEVARAFTAPAPKGDVSISRVVTAHDYAAR